MTFRLRDLLRLLCLTCGDYTTHEWQGVNATCLRCFTKRALVP